MPTAQEIADASNNGHRIQYEIVTYHGVPILILKSHLMRAITITAEFTRDKRVEQLARDFGITLRRFR